MLISSSFLILISLIGAEPAAVKAIKPIQDAKSKFRPLRIAQVAPLDVSVPPKKYGGTERVIYFLTEELIRMGHNVTLFASGDSKTSAKLISVGRSADFKHDAHDDQILYAKVFENLDDFDILHFHNDLSFAFTQSFRNKTVTTLHWRYDTPPVYQEFFRAFAKTPVVAISGSQSKHLPEGTNVVGIAHHGIPKDILPFNKHPRNPGSGEYGYLAFLGRVAKEKGIDAAIEISRRTKIPLKIAAKIENCTENCATWAKVETAYWQDELRPMVKENAGLVQMLGVLNETEKAKLLGQAYAVLFPIDWPEPFGLVMIEALATGTPVIARRRGSVPEVIEHGVTGFIYETIDEAVEYVKRVKELDRARVRREFEKRFTSTVMANNYLKAYEVILERNHQEQEHQKNLQSDNHVDIK